MKKISLVVSSLFVLSLISACSSESDLTQIAPQSVSPVMTQSSSAKKTSTKDLISKYFMGKQDLIGNGEKVTVLMFNAKDNDRKLINAYFKKALTADKRKFVISDSSNSNMQADFSTVTVFATAEDKNNFGAYIDKLLKAE